MKKMPRLITLIALTLCTHIAFAEISGSGFHQLGCDAKIKLHYYNDTNGNGIYDDGESSLSNVDVSISRTYEPELGSDTLTTDDRGRAVFFNLCPVSHNITTVTDTLPSGYQLFAVTDDIPYYDAWNGNPVESELVIPFASTRSDIQHHISLGYVENSCELQVSASCFVDMGSAVPSTVDYDCDKKVEELTMIWAGAQNIRVVAHKGKLDDLIIADIDNIAPGTEVKIGGLLDAPKDVIWEIYNAGTQNKIGESAFHLSCSDKDMDGPADCGAAAGDGKNNDKCSGGNGSCMNDWIFEGWLDSKGEVNCTVDYPTTPLLGNELSCTTEGPNEVNFQYTLTNNSEQSVNVMQVNDSVLGALPGLPEEVLEQGDSYTFAYSDVIESSHIRQLSVSSFSDNGAVACTVAADVNITVDPAPSPCESIHIERKSMGHDKVELKLHNISDRDAVYTALEFSWPAEHEKLKKVKVGDEERLEDEIEWSDQPTVVLEQGFVDVTVGSTTNQVRGHIVRSHDFEKIKLEFDKHVHDSPQVYDMRFEFEEACEVSYAIE